MRVKERAGSSGSDAQGLKFGIVASRWNSSITERLLEGALAALRGHGAQEDDIRVIRVPGAWEIPVAAHRMVSRLTLDAVICIGCIVRGETPHFDYLAQEVTRALGQMAVESSIPVTYGILTVEDMDQAVERAGGSHGNKGADAAEAAIETAILLRGLDSA